MPYFPVFIDLSEKKILVVGAGRIAARRVKTLTDFAPDITVAAPSVCEELRRLEAEGRIRILERGFEEQDLDGAEMVLTAADDPELNEKICRLCRERHIPVNNAGDQKMCDFFFPGIARKDQIVIGVTAGGTDHRKAREVTEAVRGMLDRLEE